MATLTRLLPILLIGTLITGQMLFVVGVVIPAWREHELLSAEVAALQTQAEEQANASDAEIIQHQIARTQEDLNETSAVFITEAQADEMLDTLYTYASTNNVLINTMQARQLEDVTANDAYDVRAFRIEVGGQVPQLLQFVTTIREATVPSVQISDLSITSDSVQALLTLHLTMYTTQYTEGAAFTAAQQTVPVAMPMITMPTATSAGLDPVSQDPVQLTVSNPLATPTPAGVLPSPTIPANIVNPVTVAMPSPAAPTTASGINACPGAAPSAFAPGDTVVVDFNANTRLNILDNVRTVENQRAGVLTQAMDNAVLRLIDGPVCGNWRGMPVWYWYADYGGITGWVGEGTVVLRWLCPADNPECVS